MTASWEAKLPQEFTFPATVGLVVVLVTVIILLVVSSRRSRKFLGGKGTKYVVDEDGANVVRRSTRSTKKPTRFEPALHGQGETPTASPAERVTPRSTQTPKAVADKVTEAIKAVANDTPSARRGPGRPKRTPQKEATSPATSPIRTRRGAKTPK